MARDGTVSRTALLAAGLRLAETQGLASLSINAVVREAGLAKGTFYVHFPTRQDYFVALHDDFHEALAGRIEDASADTEVGLQRLRAGIAAYLDGCLASGGVKALLLEARAEPAVAAQVQRRNRLFAKRIEDELKAMRWTDAAAAARLLVAMIAEAALAELEAGRRLPAIRRVIDHVLDRPAATT